MASCRLSPTRDNHKGGAMKLSNYLKFTAPMVAVVTAQFVAPSYAQTPTYPTKPIRFIVANAPGGGLDVVARLVSPTLISSLGEQIIVDNRAGAAGSVAAELTAKSPSDGY